MAFNRERVEHALYELLARTVPEDPNDSEDQFNEQLDEAFTWSMDQLIAAGAPTVVSDINHVASLIDRRSKTRCIFVFGSC